MCIYIYIYIFRSEGVPRTGLFHPWARWGRGPVAGEKSVSSSRDRVGMRGGWGCAHVILSPNKET